jgi:hypothetical protein
MVALELHVEKALSGDGRWEGETGAFPARHNVMSLARVLEARGDGNVSRLLKSSNERKAPLRSWG